MFVLLSSKSLLPFFEGDESVYDFLAWTLVWGLVGAFGTAFLREKTGRGVTMGEWIGLGGRRGRYGWYYGSGGTVGRMYGVPRKRWYRWLD